MDSNRGLWLTGIGCLLSGAVGVMTGISALSRGQTRQGWFAIGVGVVALGLVVWGLVLAVGRRSKKNRGDGDGVP